MRYDLVVDLSDCTTFRQTLLARPPRIIHGTALLLVGLCGVGLLWSALAEADLVVRAPGRVRPLATPGKIFNAAAGGTLSAGSGGRVIEVNFREGDEVKQGAILIRLETARLDNEIARQRRALQTAEEESASLRQLEELMGRQLQAARAKADAELAQALEEVGQARERQAVDIRLAEVEVERAKDEDTRLRQLGAGRAAAAADLTTAAARLREAQEKLTKTRLPLDQGRVKVLRRALELVEHDHAVKAEEIKLKLRSREGDAAAIRIELDNRYLERTQAEIRAPRDGVVTWGDVKVGDLLEPGKPVAEIAEQQGFLFEAAVPSEDVGPLQVGLPARVKLDAYDHQRYGTLSGTVCFLSPDSGASESQQRGAYLVRIRLDSDEVGRGECRGKVRLGMTGQIDVVTGRQSLLSLLLKRLRQTISLG
jgi:multidrug resistance efflux pump